MNNPEIAATQTIVLPNANDMQALISAQGIPDEVGTIEAGKRADLVVLTADPLTDIRNTRRIEYVFLAGRRLRPDSLLGR